MKVLLPTQPQLLRGHFRQARLGLDGLKGSKKRFFEIGTIKTESYQWRKVDWHQLSKRLASGSLLFISIISIVVGGFLFVPDLYYRVFPADIKPVESLEVGSTWGGRFKESSPDVKESELAPSVKDNDGVDSPKILPEKNENLPAGEWLIIPRIGVRTEIRATAEAEEALQEGVWLVPGYGHPEQLDENSGDILPMIMAAHRYGWQWWWQSDYWRYHSFYRLPELEPGDLVEVIVDQRKWTYEVFAGEEGEDITNYEADLILYTCKFLNSSIRHFRYARLIDLEDNTQEISRNEIKTLLEVNQGTASG